MPFLNSLVTISCSIVAVVALSHDNSANFGAPPAVSFRFDPTISLAQAQPIADVTQEIQSAWKALDTIHTFQVQQTEVVGDKTYVAMQEFVRPDRYCLLIHSSDIETIVVGDMQYQRIGNSPWSVTTLPGFGYQANQAYASLINGIAVITNAKLIGQQPLDGISTLVYEYDTVSTLENDGTISINRLWVSVETGLPQCWETTVTFFSLEPSLITETVAIFSYQSDRSIEPPI